jgi:hypothetical protein
VELSILIPTVSSRRSLLSRLLWTLEPQVRMFAGQVEVLVHADDRVGVGTKCDEMFHNAQGRFVVSVDDDDLVTPDYVSAVMEGIWRQTVPDFVGYRILYTRDGVYQAEIVHDPARGQNHSGTWLRHISLKCPIRRDLVLSAPQFTDRPGGDFRWLEGLIRVHPVWDTVFIDRCLYHYDFWDGHTLGPAPGSAAPQRDVGLYPYDTALFRWWLGCS